MRKPTDIGTHGTAFDTGNTGRQSPLRLCILRKAAEYRAWIYRSYNPLYIHPPTQSYSSRYRAHCKLAGKAVAAAVLRAILLGKLPLCADF